MSRPGFTLIAAISIGLSVLGCANRRIEMEDSNAKMQMISELLLTIDDGADPFHADVTPSVQSLIQIGGAAAQPTLALMNADSLLTRLRAEYVVRAISMRLSGYELGTGWKDHAQRRAWEAEWNALGGLDANASQEARSESIARVSAWLDSKGFPASGYETKR